MSSSPKKTKKKRVVTQVKDWSVSKKLEVKEMRDNGACWIKIAQDKGMKYECLN